MWSEFSKSHTERLIYAYIPKHMHTHIKNNWLLKLSQKRKFIFATKWHQRAGERAKQVCMRKISRNAATNRQLRCHFFGHCATFYSVCCVIMTQWRSHNWRCEYLTILCVCASNVLRQQHISNSECLYFSCFFSSLFARSQFLQVLFAVENFDSLFFIRKVFFRQKCIFFPEKCHFPFSFGCNFLLRQRQPGTAENTLYLLDSFRSLSLRLFVFYNIFRGNIFRQTTCIRNQFDNESC